MGKFLGTFFFAIALIIGIAVIFDYSEKIDDFMEHNAPFKAIVFDYYLNFIPYYANLFSYLFVFIAVIFFTSKMAGNTEIVAILASGVSFGRLLRPYMLSAGILAIASFLLSSYVIPPAMKARLEFEQKYYRGRKERFRQKNFHKQTRPGEFIYVESYNTTVDIGYKFTLENYNTEGKLVRRLISDHVRWNKDSARWTVYDYAVRVIKGDHEDVFSSYRMDTTINMHPSEFTRNKYFVETMNIHELEAFLQESIIAGVPTEAILVEKYKRFAAPFAAFILTLIGVSLASQKSRRGTGVHIGIGLGLSFGYILFQQVSAQFGIKGGLHPLLAVWIPNILFASIGIYLYRNAPK